MRQAFPKWLVVCALIVATGGHWAFLQSAAWVGMVLKFSRTESIVVAVEKTFDGRHPCGLCKVVAAARKSGHKQASLKVETKLDFCLAGSPLAIDGTTIHLNPSATTQSLRTRSDSPPTPPPRPA